MASDTVRLTGWLICKSDTEAEIVRRHLPEHLCLTRNEPGCLSFHVEPTDDPLIWRVDESFADREAFLGHQSRARASAWGMATAGIARDYQVSGQD